MGLEESDQLRSFAPCTERILMYGSEAHDLTGLQTIEKEYIAPRNPFAIELKRARLEKGVSVTKVAEYGHFYGGVNHGGSVTNWEKGYNVPSVDQWKILCDNLPIKRKEYNDPHSEYQELRRKYENIRQEHEELRRHFENVFHHSEVLWFDNEAIKTGAKYDHDTVKPELLTRTLILSCSKVDSLVVIPFAGSGTECAMSVKEKRRFIGFDISEKYVKMSNKRAENIMNSPTLF